MLAIIPDQIESAPTDYRKRAADLFRVNPHSGEGAAFEFVAADLEARMQAARDAQRKLLVPEYAKRCGINPATVRKWIYAGELQATKNARGDWEIPAGAVRQKART